MEQPGVYTLGEDKEGYVCNGEWFQKGSDLWMIANELAKFKQPKKVFVTTELPRNAMGKVQKKDLRAQHSKTFTT